MRISIGRLRRSVTDRYVYGKKAPLVLFWILQLLASFIPKLKSHLFYQLISLDFGRNQIALPQASSRLPKIEVVMALHQKDLDIFSIVLGSICRRSVNPITRVTVVTQPQVVKQVNQIISGLKNNFAGISFLVVSEDNFLDKSVLEACSKFGVLRGWLLQQCIKLKGGVDSDSSGILMHDADTIFLEDILWLDEELKSFIWATPHLSAFKDAFSDSFPTIHVSENPFGHCGHSLLCKPYVLKKLFIKISKEMPKYTNLWADLDPNDQLPTSLINDVLVELLLRIGPNNADYELYSKFAIVEQPEFTILKRFSNLSLLRSSINEDNSVTRMMDKFSGKVSSISLHVHEPESHEIDWKLRL
jgi:hypothetical protein